MALPAPRIIAAALLAFSLTACTHAIAASPHPQYNPPAATADPAADPAAETAAPTAAASAVPTTDAVAVAVAPAQPPPVVWVTSPRPAPKVVPAVVVAPPRQVAPRKPAEAPATEASAPTTTEAASTTTPPPAPAAHTGPYIDNRVVVEGGPCPNIYATGRTADGAPMKCKWDGDVTHRAGWEPL